MLESVSVGCNHLPSNCAPKDIWTNRSMAVNQLTYKLVQVEGDSSFVPATGDELIEVEHLLAEPLSEKILDGDVMFVGSEDTGKCLAVEDFPCTIDYYNNEEFGYGILDAAAPQAGKEDSKNEFVDSLLQGVDEEENVHHSTCNLSSVCSDFLLERNNTQFDFGLYGSSIKRLGAECQTYILEKDLGLGEMSDLSSAINPMPESTPDQNPLFLDNMNIRELQDAFRSIFGRDTGAMDKQWLMRRILFGLQNFSEIGNASSFVDNGLSSIENEICMILSPENGLSDISFSSSNNILDNRTLILGQGGFEDGHAVADNLPATSEDYRVVFGLLGEQEGTNNSKRLRKPTRRYIEETSESESRCLSERIKSPFNCSTDKLLHVRKKRSTPMIVGSCSQMSSCLHSRRGRPRKDTTLMGNDSSGRKEDIQRKVVPKRVLASRLSELDSDFHDDISDNSATETRNEKRGIRKQSQKQWTVSEVMKLIEGVSQFGVGRWTEIKRHLFSASAHRTAVDLKDKWRNLLRASGAQSRGRDKVKPQKQMIVPIPHTALQRVRELSIIHPYPRVRKTKFPSAANS